LSVTLTCTGYMPGPWAEVGVQAIAPADDTVSPVGPLTRAKVQVCTGMSASVAVALALKATSSSINWLGGSVSTGASFTSVTVKVKLLLALRGGEPSSVTLILTRYTPGPWASVGVQAITPDGDTVNPVGPFTNAIVSVLSGRSASAAVALFV